MEFADSDLEYIRTNYVTLDELEREFAPDYDRNEKRFGCKPTRDLFIAAARERFPDVFAAEMPPARLAECRHFSSATASAFSLRRRSARSRS
jgi:hypothetical protein